MAAGTPKKRSLNPKQESFCQLYTKHWNATRAAKEAGYSEKAAAETGYKLCQILSVKARIAELTEHALAEAGITRERVLKELALLATVDPSEAYDNLGQLLPMREMPEHVRRAVSKVKSFEQFNGFGDDRELIGFTKEVEFSPKKGALDSLAKYLGLAPDRVEHSGPDGKPIETRALSGLSDTELAAKVAALLAKRPKESA